MPSFKTLLPLKYQVWAMSLIYCFILLLLLPVYACREARPDCHILDFGVFRLTAPGGWERFKENGIDSYVGGLTNGKDSLWFDYGEYSQEIGDYPDTNSLYARATVNGLEAIFRMSKNRKDASVAMSIPRVTKKNRFFIGGDHLAHPDAIIKIFKTIRFKGSDPTQNSDLVFTAFDNYGGRSGAYILNHYCMSCHHRMRDATGPALNHKLIAQRTDEWLMQFFTDRKQVAGDSLVLLRKQQFDSQDCYIPAALSHSEIQRLIAYLRD